MEIVINESYSAGKVQKDIPRSNNFHAVPECS